MNVEFAWPPLLLIVLTYESRDRYSKANSDVVGLFEEVETGQLVEDENIGGDRIEAKKDRVAP